MTRRDIAVWRAAILAGINATFDALDAAASVRRTIVRNNDPPDNDVSDIDAARAERILQRHGIK